MAKSKTINAERMNKKICIRLSDETKAELEKIAYEQERPIGFIARRILEQATNTVPSPGQKIELEKSKR